MSSHKREENIAELFQTKREPSQLNGTCTPGPEKKKPIFSPIKGITIETFGEKLKGNYGLETNIVSTLIY